MAQTNAAARPALSVGFILQDRFTLLPFAALIDALRLAADEGDGSRPINCAWTVIAPALNPVRASCGVEIHPRELLGMPERFDYIIVIGGLLQSAQCDDAILDYLRLADRRGVSLIGVCTGGLTLLRAGVLPGRRCCVSWYHYQDLVEAFPEARPVADQLFVADGRHITCAGGAVAIDLAAWLIERHLGRAHAQKSLHIMIVDRARPPNAPQPPAVPRVENERVRRAMLLIEQNLSEPLSAREIAQKVSLSSRQLERVFRDSVGMSLQAYSRFLRLHYGLWQLARSGHTITQIAENCGFADTSHFNRLFRRMFGQSPSEMRRSGAPTMEARLKAAGLYDAPPASLAGAPPRPQAGYLKGERRPYLT